MDKPKRTYTKKCRCMETLLPDGTCKHGCAPLGQQKRRRNTEGVKERHGNFGQMRKHVDAAAERMGVPSGSWNKSYRRFAKNK